MEEQLGEESRAAILRNASMQDRPANRSLPASFGVNLESLEAMDAANPLTTVMNTVRQVTCMLNVQDAIIPSRHDCVGPMNQLANLLALISIHWL